MLRSAVLARRLDHVAAARGEIVAGVDLLEDSRVFEPLATGLAGIAVERAGSPAQQCIRGASWPLPSLSSLRPWPSDCWPARRPFCLLGLPRMAEVLWLRFSDPFGDHPPYSAVVFHVEPGDISVVYGQAIEIRAQVEGAPVDRVELVLEPESAASERVPMFPEGGGSWRAAVANVTSEGRYYVRASGAAPAVGATESRSSQFRG